MVEMDMMLSAHANARLMYENKKLARAKELKTLEVSVPSCLVCLSLWIALGAFSTREDASPSRSSYLDPGLGWIRLGSD